MSIEHSISGRYQLDALFHGWRLQRAWHRARLELAACVLPPVDDQLALDAASGSGIVTWRFPSSRIVSCDMRVTACQAIKAHAAGALVAAADLGALPFRSGTFGGLYLLEAIEHLSADAGQMALKELRRVARPAARCLVTTPNYRSYWVFLEWLIDRLKLTPPMADGQHVSRYDSESLKGALEAAGWKVAESGSFNVLAPLVGAISASAARRVVGFERSWSGTAGPLLYCLCEAA